MHPRATGLGYVCAGRAKLVMKKSGGEGGYGHERRRRMIWRRATAKEDMKKSGGEGGYGHERRRR
jgi:hypothetical protein